MREVAETAGDDEQVHLFVVGRSELSHGLTLFAADGEAERDGSAFLSRCRLDLRIGAVHRGYLLRVMRVRTRGDGSAPRRRVGKDTGWDEECARHRELNQRAGEEGGLAVHGDSVCAFIHEDAAERMASQRSTPATAPVPKISGAGLRPRWATQPPTPGPCTGEVCWFRVVMRPWDGPSGDSRHWRLRGRGII